MTGRGPEHLRKTTNVVLDALVRAAEQALHGHAIDMRTLESLVAELKESTAFDDFYHRSYREMMEVVEGESIEQRRTNAFGRLMMHPLSGLFSEDRLGSGSSSRSCTWCWATRRRWPPSAATPSSRP
jgi:hypothetical protein